MISTETKELIVEIDNKLRPQEIWSVGKEFFNKKIRSKSTKLNLKTVRDCIPQPYLHFGYVDYLRMAWRYHAGVVFSPDYFWQIFLTELAGHIKDNSEKYRTLFTKSEEKQLIVVNTNDPQLIDLRLIMGELKSLVPTDIDLFLPEFSTTNFNASMAFSAAFADAMSPYYDYAMTRCGIPRVKVMGTTEDWDKVLSRVEKLRQVVELDQYFDTITSLAGQIKENSTNADPIFWKDMFSVKECGSGHPDELEGWIQKMFITQPEKNAIDCYPSAISFVSYTYLDTKQKFELCYGLFGSELRDGFLVPDFGFIINEEIEKI